MNFRNTYLVLALLLLVGVQTLTPNLAAAGNPAVTMTREAQQAITPDEALAMLKLGLLTSTLANINPAVNAVQGNYKPRSSKNPEFVQAVAEKNVHLTMQKLRDRSLVLREMIDSGEIGLVGAMYDVATGQVTFYD